MMITIDDCKNATVLGRFNSDLLNMKVFHSSKDIDTLSSYVSSTQLNEIFLKLEINEDGVLSFRKLCNKINDNVNIKELSIEITNIEYVNKHSNGLLSFIDAYKKKQFCQQIYEIIAQLPTKSALKKLTMDASKIEYGIASKMAIEFIVNLINSKLESIELSLNFETQELFPVIMQNRNATIKSLKLNQCRNISLPLFMFSSLGSLQSLELSNLSFLKRDTVLLSQLFKSSKTLKQVIIKNTNIGQAAPENLMDSLKHLTKLERLVFSKSHLNRFGLSSLKDVLSKSECSIKDLDLSNNMFGEKDAEKLSYCLAVNTSLTKINLSNNLIQNTGLKALFEMLELNHHIQSLHISHNTNSEIGDSVIKGLIKLVEMPYCNIEELHFKQLLDFEQYVALTDAILKSKTLTQVEIGLDSFNYQETLLKNTIQEHLAQNKSGGRHSFNEGSIKSSRGNSLFNSSQCDIVSNSHVSDHLETENDDLLCTNTFDFSH